MAIHPNPFAEGTSNQALFDALIRHQIDLMRLSATMSARIVGFLNEVEDDIGMLIRERLKNSTGFEARRLERLMTSISKLRDHAFDQADESMIDDFYDLAKQEPALLAQALQTVSPVVLDMTIPPVSKLKAIVNSKPFEGRVLKDWAERLREDDRNRIEQAIRVGMTEGETSDAIARRVLGTSTQNGLDGVTQITRNNIEAIIRTAVNHIGNDARAEFVKENKDIINSELFVATLDSRTTPICRAKDGQVYEIGVGPRPPLHWSCRSLRVPILDASALGNRPAKASTDQRLLREWAAKQKLDDVPGSRDDLAHGTKGAFDKWAAQRIRDLTGQVPASTNYGSWLKGQPAAIQDDILGKTRGALFRRGSLTLDKFINRNGDQINLKDLAKRQRDAFVAAGLDPDEY